MVVDGWPVQQPAAGGAGVVDPVERPLGGVEYGGGAPAAVQASQRVHQRQQGAHEEIPEHHVPQQLSVGPAGAVGSPAQVLRAGPGHEVVEVGLGAS